jgi:hypothetical protein
MHFIPQLFTIKAIFQNFNNFEQLRSKAKWKCHSKISLFWQNLHTFFNNNFIFLAETLQCAKMNLILKPFLNSFWKFQPEQRKFWLSSWKGFAHEYKGESFLGAHLWWWGCEDLSLPPFVVVIRYKYRSQWQFGFYSLRSLYLFEPT